MKIEQVIANYLASPVDRRAATLDKMLLCPDEAFHALMTFQGPYPRHTHPVDVFPDYLSPLLSELLANHPHLLIGRDLTRMVPGQRWILIAAVMSSGSSRFAEVVSNALRDRSMTVRAIAVEAIARCPFLRIPEARPQLQKLLMLKSMSYCRDKIQQALDALDKECQNSARR